MALHGETAKQRNMLVSKCLVKLEQPVSFSRYRYMQKYLCDTSKQISARQVKKVRARCQISCALCLITLFNNKRDEEAASIKWRSFVAVVLVSFSFCWRCVERCSL